MCAATPPCKFTDFRAYSKAHFRVVGTHIQLKCIFIFNIETLQFLEDKSVRWVDCQRDKLMWRTIVNFGSICLFIKEPSPSLFSCAIASSSHHYYEGRNTVSARLSFRASLLLMIMALIIMIIIMIMINNNDDDDHHHC